MVRNKRMQRNGAVLKARCRVSSVFEIVSVVLCVIFSSCTSNATKFKTVVENDTTKLKELAKSPAFLQLKSEDGETPLTLAARQGSARGVQILLEAGADKDARNGAGLSALAISVGRGDLFTTKVLVEHGVNPSQMASQGDSTPTVLAMCVHRQQFPVCQYLIDRGAALEQAGAKGMMALNLAVYEENVLGVEFLIKNRASCAVKDLEGNSILHLRLSGTKASLRLEILRRLLKGCSNLDLNAQDREGNTALMLASRARESDIAKLLIENGINVNTRNPKTGETALFGADSEFTVLLLGAGIDVTQKNASGKTSLDVAIGGYPPGAWKVLVDHYISKGLPLVGGVRGEHLVFKALDKGDQDFIQYVVQKGEGIGARDVFNHSILDRALEQGKYEIAKFLCKNHAPHSIEYADAAKSAGCSE